MPLVSPEAGGLVDLDADTKESEKDLDSETVDANKIANLDDKTEESPHHVVLRYAPSTPKSLVAYFKKHKVTKNINEEITLERSKTADVLLNGKVFGRNHAVLECREQENGTFFLMIKNKSNKKQIVVVKDKENLQVPPGQEVELNNNAKLKMEMLEFVVEIESGDYNANSFEFQVLPQLEPNNRIPVVHSTHPNAKVEFCDREIKPNGPSIVHGEQMVFSEAAPGCVTMSSVPNGKCFGLPTHVHGLCAVGDSNPFYTAPVPWACQNSAVRSSPGLIMNQARSPSVGQTLKGSILSTPTTEDTTKPVFLPSSSSFTNFLQVDPYVAANLGPDENTQHVINGAAVQTALDNNFVTTHAIEESNQDESEISAALSTEIVSPENAPAADVEQLGSSE